MTDIKRTLNILRKAAFSGAVRLLLQPLKLLPVRKNRVLFISYLGKQYSCNPKAISEECLRLYGEKLEIGWVFRKPADFAYLEKQGIRVLDARSFAFIKFALTARVVVTNGYYKPSLPRRKKQFYLRTWHGGGAYKKVGSMMETGAAERLFIGMQQSGADLYLSSSDAFTDLTLRKSFGYKGEVLACGMPRNDILVNPADNAKVSGIRQKAGIPEGARLCLFAPTYRKDAVLHDICPDYTRLKTALETRFGGQWVIAYRSHHVTMYLNQSKMAEGILNLTDYPDMQELLYISDVLITDYSSSIWDMSLTYKKVFLYCPDLKTYSSERDFYMDIRAWPFPLSENNDELESNILSFNEETYLSAVRRHHGELGSRETGKAAYLTAKRIGYETGLEASHDTQ